MNHSRLTLHYFSAALAIVFTVAIFGSSEGSARTISRTFDIAERGEVTLDVPVTWQSSIRRNPDGLPPTILFTTDADAGFMVSFTPLWDQTGDPGFNSPAHVRNLVEEARLGIARTAKENNFPIEKLCPGTGTGFHFSATDRNPKPNEYKYLTQGALAFGEFMAAFTVLHDDRAGRPSNLALKMVRGVACSEESASSRHAIRLPRMGWTLELNLPGYIVEDQRPRPDESGTRVSAFNDDEGIVLSVFLERERDPLDSLACRKTYFTKSVNSPLEKSRIRRWEDGPLALGEYTIRSFRDHVVMQRNVHAYVGKAGICMDLHLSKIEYRKKDAHLFDTVLAGIRIRDDG